MTTTSDLIAQAKRAQKSGHQATADLTELRRMLIALDRQPGGPSRNELARLTDGALSRRLVLNTLQAADLLTELHGLIPARRPSQARIEARAHEDGLDLFKGHWHAQVRTSGDIKLSLVPGVDATDAEIDTAGQRRSHARQLLAKLKKHGFEVLVKKSEGRDAEDSLADWGDVYLAKN